MKIEPVNQHAWHWSDKRRKKEYDKYVAFFKEKAQTVEGRRELRDKKMFNLWSHADPVSGKMLDRLGRLTAINAYEPDSWGLFCMNTADPKKLIVAAERVKARNKEKITEALKHVGGNPDAPLLNPEYLERARVTKELKKTLEKWTGSKENASDHLFAIKQDADAQGKDFVAVAKEELERMKPSGPPNVETKQLEQAMTAVVLKKPAPSWFSERVWQTIWQIIFIVWLLALLAFLRWAVHL